MENLFNTFSFGVWNNTKEAEEKELKNKTRRKKQVSKLREYLKDKEREKPTETLDNKETILNLMLDGGAENVAPAAGAATVGAAHAGKTEKVPLKRIRFSWTLTGQLA